MSVKVDTERSTKARTEGNASFKKGKWTEAIGHYTTAIVYNPQDGLGYTNRAAAYLKLDKWKDAERDCSSAIDLPKGDANVKALYRRALARKALLDTAGALKDIHAVLAIEPANGIAKEEQTELEDLQLKELSSREAEIRKPKELPPSPPRSRTTELPSGRLSATVEEISDSPNVIEPVKEIDTSLKQAETARSSFADLKKGRQAKKTFTKPTSPTPLTAVPTEVSPLSPSALPLEQVTISTPPLAPTSATISTRSHLSSESLALLDPTMPGSALSLISAIRTHTAETTWPVIADLSKEPATLGKMLDNFLEPDQLALILTRLRESLDSASVQEERKKVIVDFVAGLRMTRRWSMTAMMLSSEEKQLGQEVWTIAGGTGDWAKRT